jgi:hypothetical protein
VISPVKEVSADALQSQPEGEDMHIRETSQQVAVQKQLLVSRSVGWLLVAIWKLLHQRTTLASSPRAVRGLRAA